MLNDAKLRAAKPQAKPYKLTDSHRLYLLVTPSGGKLWRWNYVFGDKQKSLAFGVYPLVSLIDGRISIATGSGKIGPTAFFIFRLGARLANMFPHQWPCLDLMPQCPTQVIQAVQAAIPSV